MKCPWESKVRRAYVQVLLLLMLSAMPPGGQASKVLSDMLWQKRVLLVFAATNGDAQLHGFKRTLEARACGVDDRDMATVFITGAAALLAPDRSLEEGAAEVLRARYAVDADTFAVVLVGKDGGEKRRYAAPPNPDEVFSLIDTMPMRQVEAAERKSERKSLCSGATTASGK